MKKWSKLSAGGLGFLIAVSRFLWVQNKDIYTREVTYESPKIPKSFNNFKITQVSDFHNTYYGRGGKHLLKPVSYTHLTLPTILRSCRSRWSPYH